MSKRHIGSSLAFGALLSVASACSTGGTFIKPPLSPEEKPYIEDKFGIYNQCKNPDTWPKTKSVGRDQTPEKVMGQDGNLYSIPAPILSLEKNFCCDQEDENVRFVTHPSTEVIANIQALRVQFSKQFPQRDPYVIAERIVDFCLYSHKSTALKGNHICYARCAQVVESGIGQIQWGNLRTEESDPNECNAAIAACTDLANWKDLKNLEVENPQPAPVGPTVCDFPAIPLDNVTRDWFHKVTIPGLEVTIGNTAGYKEKIAAHINTCLDQAANDSVKSFESCPDKNYPNYNPIETKNLFQSVKARYSYGSVDFLFDGQVTDGQPYIGRFIHYFHGCIVNINPAVIR